MYQRMRSPVAHLWTVLQYLLVWLHSGGSTQYPHSSTTHLYDVTDSYVCPGDVLELPAFQTMGVLCIDAVVILVSVVVLVCLLNSVN